jgi:hypothetical protein
MSHEMLDACDALRLKQACVFVRVQELRTLADQVRRRERLKKQLVKNWRDALRLVCACMYVVV